MKFEQILQTESAFTFPNEVQFLKKFEMIREKNDRGMKMNKETVWIDPRFGLWTPCTLAS